MNYRIRLAGEADGNVIADSISLTNLDGVSNVFSWHTTVPLTGQYEVYARWTASGDCATNTTYSILSDSGVDDVVVNQQTEGARWNLLGTYNFTQGSDYSISINDDTDGNVVADGIKLVPVAQ